MTGTPVLKMADVGAIAHVDWPRTFAVAGLLPIEAVLLSMRFDTASLRAVETVWADLIGIVPQVVECAGVIALAALLINGPALLTEIVKRADEATLPAMRAGWWLSAHFIALMAFASLTEQVLELGHANAENASLWMFAWLLSAICTLALWSLSLFPARLWRRLAISAGPGLASAVVVGATVWYVGLYAERLWIHLAAQTLWCVRILLSAFYADIVCRPDEFVIGTPSFHVTIAPACSGYQAMGLAVLTLVIYLYVKRQCFRFPEALLLIPMGAGLVWVGNVVRITSLLAIGTSWSPSIALGGFHSQAGWLAFIGIVVGLIAAARSLRFDSAEPAAAVGANPAAPYLAPLLTVLCLGLVTGAFTNGVDPMYPLRVVAGAGALWHYRQTISAARWQPSALPIVAGMVVFLLWLLFAIEGTQTPVTEQVSQWPTAWAAGWWASRLAGFILVAPLAEELAFRGFLMRRLMAADFEQRSLSDVSGAAWLVSSAAFGAMHGSNWLAGGLAGLVYAFTASRRGCLRDAALAHTTTNALLAFYSTATGHFSSWS